MGNQPSNNKAIEPQLLRRFLRDNFACSYQFPNEFEDAFKDLVPQERLVGSCQDTCPFETALVFGMLPTKFSRSVFDLDDVCQLKRLYCILNGCISTTLVCTVFKRYSSVTIGTYVYHSTGKQSSKPCIAMATWDTRVLGAFPTTLPDSDDPNASTQPVNIHYFLKVNFECATDSNVLLLARVSWYSPHPDRHIIGKPAEVWRRNLYESFGLHSFLPLKYVLSHCAYCYKVINDDNVLVVVPLLG